MNPGMQRLDATIHHLGETGDLRDIAHFDAGVTENPGGSPGANDFHIKTFQLAREIHNSRFVRNADKRTTNRAQAVGILSRHMVLKKPLSESRLLPCSPTPESLIPA